MFFIRWTLLENVICVAVLHASALVRTDSVKLSRPSVILVLLPENKRATKTKTLQQGLARIVVTLWQHQHALATNRAFQILMAVDFSDRCFGLNRDQNWPVSLPG